MGKSARVLGDEQGLTAPEMNFALKQAGLLEGAPQRWSVTEEGKQYAAEERKWNGVGGHQQYIIDYEQRTWDDKVLEALDLDDDKKREAREAASDSRRQAREAREVAPGTEPDAPSKDSYSMDLNDAAYTVAAGLAVIGVAYGIYKLAPRLKRRWDEKRSRSEGSET